MPKKEGIDKGREGRKRKGRSKGQEIGMRRKEGGEVAKEGKEV